MEAKIKELKKKREVLNWTFIELIKKAREEGVENYQDKIWTIINEMIKLEYEPYLEYVKSARADCDALEKTGDEKVYAFAWRMRLLYQFFEHLMTKIINDKTECLYTDISIGLEASKVMLRLSKVMNEIYKLALDSAVAVKSIGKLPQEIQQELSEIKQKLKELEERRIEISVKVQRKIEKELKEWVKEKEEMKKALKRYMV